MDTIISLLRRSGSPRCFILPALLALLLVGTGICAASTITLAWDPQSSPDLAGYRVYYSATPDLPFAGTGAVQGPAPVTLSTSTTATITGLDPGQTYYFAVTAFSTSGIETPYSSIVQVPELIPPSVAVASPPAGSQVSGLVPVTVDAADNVGVSRVELYVDGQLQETATAAPYLFSWDTGSLAAGSYALSARAYDAAGNLGQSGSVTFTVVKDAGTPSVTLTQPTAGSAVQGTVPLSATASDDTGVARVEFYADGGLVCAGNVAPFGCSWDTAGLAQGPHTLTARAYDTSGNVGYSRAVPVQVGNPLYTVADAQLALQIASRFRSATPDQLSRLDVAPYLNGRSAPNGVIDTGDVVVILSLILGLL